METKIIIETEKLLLRKITEEDAAEIFLLNADQDVIRYTSDPALQSFDDAVKLIETIIRPQYHLYNHGRWAVILKQTNEFTGWCGLKYLPETDAIDLGYRFHKKYWGQGIASEAAKASLKYGFEKLLMKKITGRAMKENIASIKVLEKCGMKFLNEADLHEHPAFIYEITREDYERMMSAK
jgi:RimJ/RimL family protein N-acetyltransferase